MAVIIINDVYDEDLNSKTATAGNDAANAGSYNTDHSSVVLWRKSSTTETERRMLVVKVVWLLWSSVRD